MSFDWDAEGLNTLVTKDLGLLTDEQTMLELDEKMLQNLAGEDARRAGAAGAGEPGPSSAADAHRCEEAAARSQRLADEDDDDDMGDFGLDGDKLRLGKRGRPMTNTAVAKANREKARREKLNDCCEELAKLCDPSGRSVKNDRMSVVTDAIRVLTQLRVENSQLRQLNKFLEERVATYERVRAQSLYQTHLLAHSTELVSPEAAAALGLPSSSFGAGALGGMEDLVAGSKSCSAPDASLAGSQAHLATSGGLSPSLPPHVVAYATGARTQAELGAARSVPPAHGAAALRPAFSSAPNLAFNGARVEGPASPPSLDLFSLGLHGFQGLPLEQAAPLFALKHEHLASAAGVELGVGPGAGAERLGVAGVPELSWLPSPDATQDSKLRPPAA